MKEILKRGRTGANFGKSPGSHSRNCSTDRSFWELEVEEKRSGAPFWKLGGESAGKSWKKNLRRS